MSISDAFQLNEMFQCENEEILFFGRCIRHNIEKKKKQDSFLCLIHDPLHPYRYISMQEVVKKNENKSSTHRLKRKHFWSLLDLLSIDGKNGSSNFSLIFDKTYYFNAISVEEKHIFLTNLINLALNSLPRHQLIISNLPSELMNLEDRPFSEKKTHDTNGRVAQKEKFTSDDASEYQILTTKETNDLLTEMESCSYAVTNADLFVKELTSDLVRLDVANIYSVMTSEESIDSLVALIDRAISQTNIVEERLDRYVGILELIQRSVLNYKLSTDDTEEGSRTISVENLKTNNKTLLCTLSEIIEKSEFSPTFAKCLQEADFTSTQSLQDCLVAAHALHQTLSHDIDPLVLRLTGISDQRKRCEKLADKFSKSIFRYLNNLFIHLSNETMEGRRNFAEELKICRRKKIHDELTKYVGLVHWLSDMDRNAFLELQDIYRKSLGQLYQKDIHTFFANAKCRIGGLSVSRSNLTQSITASLADVSGKKLKSSRLLGNDSDSVTSEVSSQSERDRFDEILETILIEVEFICTEEQEFIVNYFRLDINNKENTRQFVAEVFPTLRDELINFISFYERIDSFSILHSLVRLNKHVLSTNQTATDTGSFLAVLLGFVLVEVKRSFDRFMHCHVTSIQEAKITNRHSKCGILPFITKFERFVNSTEKVFAGSDRRVDLEKWYVAFVTEIIVAVNRVAPEHGRTPSAVIMMENYHTLLDLLSQMKVNALEPLKKDVKQKYNESLNQYVTQYFGKPLEKINIFFEGVQQLLATGFKESEICYQLAYSKQELRRVIALYPGREVRRGLENLYKKVVERHLCQEANLFEVVWIAMQTEFIAQYKTIEDLIRLCYPGYQISLHFDINQILQYFTEIAMTN